MLERSVDPAVKPRDDFVVARDDFVVARDDVGSWGMA
jgi:hypothetical protein